MIGTEENTTKENQDVFYGRGTLLTGSEVLAISLTCYSRIDFFTMEQRRDFQV